jgi:hypothetical protein
VPVDLKQDHSHWASMRFTTMGHGDRAAHSAVEQSPASWVNALVSKTVRRWRRPSARLCGGHGLWWCGRT